MNKILHWIKNILLLTLVILNITFLKEFSIYGIYSIIYYLLVLILTTLTIKDNITREKINNNNKYNILFILIELIIIFINLRALYDQNFLYNSSYYISQLSKMEYFDIDVLKSINILYLYQNMPYFITMLLLILIYRRINIPKKIFIYNVINTILICLSILFLLESFSKGSLVGIILLIVLIISEIISLIKSKKNRWIIYLSFIINLLSIIFFIANLL